LLNLYSKFRMDDNFCVKCAELIILEA